METTKKISLKLNEKEMMNLLDQLYAQAKKGIPYVSPSVEDLANEYLNRYQSKKVACKKMQKNQIIKCTTSGAVAGLGGFVTLPIVLPANITNVLYVQLRMIACTAYMAGYNLSDDETQTFVYACLAGLGLNNILKNAGIMIGVKLFNGMVKKIPGKFLVKINQKVGFRLLTKFGAKGVVNLGKLVPGVGAVIGGSFDYIDTKIVADRAYKWFFENNFLGSDKEQQITLKEIEQDRYETIEINDESVS